MNIWLINHYAVPPQYYPLARQTYFAKYLMEMGHTVTIFAASTVHNSNQNLITDGAPYREETINGVHYVYIRCRGYSGNGVSRIYNMMEFAWKLPGVCKRFSRPDAIVATSMPPVSCAAGIRLARKYGCRGIAEIADLWPESIVAYGIAGKNNPLVVLLRRLEKWIYKKANAIVFTMEGGYDYIIEQGWDKEIPRSKVFHINNGVDLAQFHENMEHNPLQDDDLMDPDTFKVVYTGSIRKANGLELLVDCAERLKDQPKIRFLVYGAGDDVERLRDACKDREIHNLVFKGPVDKTYVPYILSKSDLNVLNYNPDSTVIYRFGSSQNKLFEYLASGKPILSTVKIAYSILEKYNCGIEAEDPTAEGVSQGILKLYHMTPQQRLQIQENCQKAAEEYDFKQLTRKLMDVIEGGRR